MRVGFAASHEFAAHKDPGREERPDAVSLRGPFDAPPRQQRLADPKLLVDDEKVGGSAGLQPAETAAKHPPWTLRDGGDCVGRVEPEGAEVDEPVGQPLGAAGEDAVCTS